MDVPVYDMKGATVGTMQVDEASLGGTVNPSLLKQAFVMYHANQRQGSARTKSRGQVEGSTRKLYRQKGTGRARHGNAKANLMRGGGHGFAKSKKREDFHLKMPKKMRRNANRNALLAKLIDDEVRVVDSITFDKPQTKVFAEFLKALKIDRSALVALSNNSPESKKARLSARNIDDVTLCSSDQLTCFEMLNHRYMVISKADLEAWLSGPSSHTGKGVGTAGAAGEVA